MSRLNWDRCSDRTTSESSFSEVELRVELDKGAVPPYVWEVRGYSATRTGAFDAAERAAVASLRTVSMQSAEIEELIRAIQDEQAVLTIRGQRQPSLLKALVQLALEGSLRQERSGEPGAKGVRLGVRRKTTRAASDA
jgi:hypothetical protein